VTRDWGRFSWHWFFMIQPYDLPERMMGADPDFYIQKKLAKTKQGLGFFDKDALAEYMRCFRNPATIHAMCEDYRATFGSISTWTRRISPPAARSPARCCCCGAQAAGSAATTSRRDLVALCGRHPRRPRRCPCGHYLSEEAPEETYRELREFFAAP